MKKYWEINGVTLEESTKTALKQIQKFAEKKKLAPVKLIEWQEHSTEVRVGLVFKDVPEAGIVNIAEWIKEHA